MCGIVQVGVNLVEVAATATRFALRVGATDCWHRGCRLYCGWCLLGRGWGFGC